MVPLGGSHPDLDILRSLGAAWGGTWMRLPAGQVLRYAGHRAVGVHVVVSGALETVPDDPSPARRLEPREAPLLVPVPARLDVPAEDTLAVVADADVLFFPRHVVQAEPELSAALEALTRPRPRG